MRGLWEKLASGLIVPPIRWLHHPCCCGSGPPDGPCPWCETAIPFRIQLVIADVVDGLLCDQCDENLNDTFVLDWRQYEPSTGLCCWTYDFGSEVCSERQWLDFILDQSAASVSFSSDPCGLTSDNILFNKTITQPFNCQTLSLSMDPVFNNYCNTEATPATCTASSL